MSLAIADNRLLPALLPPFSIAAGASPFTWTNALGVRVLIVVSGGIVTAISITRLGISTSLGLTSGSFILDPGDSITVTYSSSEHGRNSSMRGVEVGNNSRFIGLFRFFNKPSYYCINNHSWF